MAASAALSDTCNSSLWRRIRCLAYSAINDIGAKTENFVASHLFKAINWWNDNGYGEYGLYFLRDKEKREVDFLVTKDRSPWFMVEVKTTKEKSISENLRYFYEKTEAHMHFKPLLQWIISIKIAFPSNALLLYR